LDCRIAAPDYLLTLRLMYGRNQGDRVSLAFSARTHTAWLA